MTDAGSSVVDNKTVFIAMMLKWPRLLLKRLNVGDEYDDPLDEDDDDDVDLMNALVSIARKATLINKANNVDHMHNVC